jgi:hypothetical protein
MATRTLYLSDLKTGDSQPVATFEMTKAGKLLVEWEDGMDYYRDDIEGAGIVANGKVLYPKDGKAFYEALPRAYATSSTMYVKDA